MRTQLRLGRVALHRKPEVEHLGGPVRSHDDVVGLHVAMDDALRVRGGQAAADIHEHLEDLVWGPRLLPEPRAHGAAFEAGHGDEPELERAAVEASCHDDHVVHPDHIGVVETGEGARLREHGSVTLNGSNLERDGAVEPIVHGGHDEPARSSPEDVLDDVARTELRARLPEQLHAQQLRTESVLELRDLVHHGERIPVTMRR